jgi:D-arginine dehydrogenase
MNIWDIVIVGAGIAGASAAAELARDRRVCLIEMEAQPGYHATGRSAAFWTESYGGPLIQPLTSASGPLLRNPPPELGAASFLHPRRALTIAADGQAALLDAEMARFADSGIAMERVDRAAIAQMVPALRPSWSDALFEADCCDIDVTALHNAYLALAKRRGAVLRNRTALIDAEFAQGHWRVRTSGGEIKAAAIVNAAGAWADVVADRCGARPRGISPKRRTMVQIVTDPPAPSNWPLIIAADGSFYAKPEANGRFWLSPHDEGDSAPCDAAPEEIDIALAIDRFERAFALRVIKLERSWAGLRSFAPDRLPVIGPDARSPTFIWFAGQGGWGIQTAPAAAALLRAMILHDFSDAMLVNIDPQRYAANRFQS